MEEKIVIFDIQKDCRICLQSYSPMFELFGENKYGHFLKDHCIVNIEENDGLPLVICEFCLHDVLLVQNFVIKCQDTDSKLRLALKSQNEIKNPKNHLPTEDVKIEFPDYEENDFDDANVSLDEFIKQDVKDEHKYSKLKFGDQSQASSNKRKKVRHKKLDSQSKRKKRLDSKYKKWGGEDKLLLRKKPSKHDPEFPRQCTECPQMLKTRSVMLIHMVTHTSEKPFQCDHCGKCVRSKGTLKNHIVRFHLENGIRRYLCKECNRAFYRKTDLIVHLRTHSGETPYKCKFCPKSYSQTATLLRHLRTHTGQKPYSCSECSKAFFTSSERNRHKSKHSKERNYSCTECGQTVKTRESLRHHMLLHSNPKSHVCDQCGTFFNNRGNLRMHIKRVHSDKAGVCSLCKKSFSNIEDHMRTHTGEMPFECNLCGQKYSLKQSLRIHIRKHDDCTKFSCKYDGCTRTFKLNSMLDFHISKCHMKQPRYLCRYCARGFFRLSDIRRHTDVSHADKEFVSSDDLRKSNIY